MASTTPVKAWEVSEGIDTPESTYYHSETKTLFVANIAGGGTDKDGKGWISKLDLDGKVLEAKWVQGLNAPKGMRSSDNFLWVSDIDRVHKINIDNKEIKTFEAVEKDKNIFLNDIAIDPLSGDVYISDTIGEKIYRIADERITVFADGDNLEGPNGLLVVDDKLLVGGWGKRIGSGWDTTEHGNLYSLGLARSDTPGKKTVITKDKVGQLDGLEVVSFNQFIVSDWMNGQISVIHTGDGSHAEILNTRKGTADIAWIQSEKLLIIPQMEESKILAYEIRGCDCCSQ